LKLFINLGWCVTAHIINKGIYYLNQGAPNAPYAGILIYSIIINRREAEDTEKRVGEEGRRGDNSY